ncbi:MAG TPA: DUF5681 domain-containing protein [Alloacidobacterium sp.]|nr:DUF5681 domain-containing protein [Alloacidobacterium sp.]
MAKFQKGVSGNPAGRKPGSKSHISKELEKIAKAGGGKVAKQIAEKLTELTLAGNVQAAKLLLDRLEGRVKTAEELAKVQPNGNVSANESRKQLIQLLRSPELRGLVEEAINPISEVVN